MNKYRIYVKVSSKDRSRVEMNIIKAKSQEKAEELASIYHDYNDGLLEDYVILNTDKVK